MPRPRSSNRAYQFHVSGNAKFRLAGKDFYLGERGSPESYALYHALIAEYNANGRKLPEVIQTKMIDIAIRVRDVIAEHRIRVLSRYKPNSGAHARLSVVLNSLDNVNGAASMSQHPRTTQLTR